MKLLADLREKPVALLEGPSPARVEAGINAAIAIQTLKDTFKRPIDPVKFREAVGRWYADALKYKAEITIAEYESDLGPVVK